MNVVNNESVNALKQSSNDRMKTPTIENDYNKLENSQSQIETLDYTENKINIDEIRQNIIRENAWVTNTDMKDRASLKKNEEWQKQRNADGGSQLFHRSIYKTKPNLMLLNKVIGVNAAVISPVTVTQK